jgi:hypothetical protein
MNKILLFLIFLSCFHYAQTFKVEKITGSVKIQAGSSENWEEVKVNSELRENAVVMTEKNSYVRLARNGLHFTLKESSALHLSGIKKMSIDDLLLALAMEDMINTPNSNDQNKSENTAVYGSKTGSSTASEENTSESFGIKRMNGAIQLAESGFKESAVITAKETYRKYPDTKKNAFYRIYFADVLYECGLYAEAFEEFNEIKSLPLTEQEKSEVNDMLNLISKKLIN